MKKTITYSPIALKAPDSKGQFTAYIAETWPEDTPKKNADADGDIFLTGAFDEQDGDKIPVFYQHDYAPTSEVGEATLHPGDSREVLPATGQLFVDKGKPIADAVYESMLLPNDDPNALKEFSVGYEFDRKDIFKRPDGIRVIQRSKVIEVSVVYQGSQRTELVSVKAMGTATTTTGTVPVNITLDVEEKHQDAPRYIQAAHDALSKAGAKCKGEEPKSTDEEPDLETKDEVPPVKADPHDDIRRKLEALTAGL